MSAAEPLATELDRIAALGVDEVRSLWRQTFHQHLPACLSREMLARMIAYRIQEQRLGGLDPGHRKLLDRLAQGGGEPVRRLKVGTLIVREHRGVLHEVAVVPGGFQWQGTIYASLSTIARAITGTAWNGPRFFGLRSEGQIKTANDREAGSSEKRPRPGPRGSIRPSGGGTMPPASASPSTTVEGAP